MVIAADRQGRLRGLVLEPGPAAGMPALLLDSSVSLPAGRDRGRPAGLGLRRLFFLARTGSGKDSRRPPWTTAKS